MNDNTNFSNSQPGPNPDLKSLDRLVGTWKMSGDTKGKVTYEWMEGEYEAIATRQAKRGRKKK